MNISKVQLGTINNTTTGEQLYDYTSTSTNPTKGVSLLLQRYYLEQNTMTVMQYGSIYNKDDLKDAGD
jgi:hypothetical protein